MHAMYVLYCMYCMYGMLCVHGVAACSVSIHVGCVMLGMHGMLSMLCDAWMKATYVCMSVVYDMYVVYVRKYVVFVCVHVCTYVMYVTRVHDVCCVCYACYVGEVCMFEKLRMYVMCVRMRVCYVCMQCIKL